MSLGERVLYALLIIALTIESASAQIVDESTRNRMFLIKLTGPDGQVIYINPSAVVSVRAPRGADTVGPAIHCILHTNDGKFIAVAERCNAFVQEAN